MVARPTEQACAYCGATATTRDHVPTRKLFPEPRPSNLITVPSCARCNNLLSADEEYFVRVLLSVREADSPAAHEARRQHFAKLRTPRRRRMSEYMLSTARPVALRTPAGIFLGTGYTFELDSHRFTRVVDKIMRGLWYVAFGERADDAPLATVQLNPEPDALLTGVVQNGARARVGDVFAFSIARWAGPPTAGVCVMQFYGGTVVASYFPRDPWRA
jgi:hypothetical protein